MYFKDIIGQEEIKKTAYTFGTDRCRPACPAIHGTGGCRRLSSHTGLRTLSELYEPDGNGFMRALSVMPEV